MNLIHVTTLSDLNKVWVGDQDQGGYVMLEDFAGIVGCYSFGIGGDVAWDLYLANLGLPVYQYDHTVSTSPCHHDNFHFFKQGLGVEDKDDLKSLATTLRSNRHESTSNLLLKIDIEGDEWPVLDSLNSNILSQFRQIVCEFHDLHRATFSEFAFRDRVNRVFSLLERTHYPVHHRNTKVGIPEAAEITWALRSAYPSGDLNGSLARKGI
jgi:hypothetical protein